MKQLTEIYTIRFSVQQAESLQKLKDYDVNISKFIRLAKEREEFGMMLMRRIDSFTPEERKRYDELKAILKEG